MMQHILGLFYFAVIFTGPLPLCLGIIRLLESKEKNKHETGFSHRLFIVITCWCILQTGIGLVAGILQRLNLSTVLLAEVMIFIAGTALLMAIKRKTPSLRCRDLLETPKPFEPPGKLIAGIILFFCVLLLWVSMTCPVKEYDSLAFHLPVMAKWYQTGSFSMLEQFKQIGRYPYNWEALCTLYIMPFGEYFTVGIPNVIAWLLFGLSVYLLALKTGAARIHALAASALVMILPIVLYNVNTMHIDLPFAAFFTAALYLIVHSLHTRSLGYVSLFLAVLGMLAGVKTSGLIYGSILLAVFVLMFLKSTYRNKKFPAFSLQPLGAAISFSTVGVLSFLLLGGYWYLRNFIQVGNPLGFVKVRVGNLLLFPGTMEASDLYGTTLAEVFDLTRLAHWKVFLGQIVVKLGLPFCAMIFLLLILLFTFFTRKKSPGTRLLIGLSALLAVTLILYWLTPYSGTDFTRGNTMTSWFGQAIRYAFPFIGVLGVLAAAGAGGTNKFRIPGVVLASVVLTGSITGLYQLGKHFDLINENVLYPGFILLLLWGMGTVFAKNTFKYSRWLTGLAILVLIVAVTFIMRDKRDTNRRLIYGDIVDYIGNHIDRHETIGYMYSHRSYLFYGKKLQRNVMYVPPREKKFSQWLDMLREKGVDVIAVGPLGRAQKKNKRLNRHLQWLKDPNAPFIHTFGGNLGKDPHIYRLKIAENVQK